MGEGGAVADRRHEPAAVTGNGDEALQGTIGCARRPIWIHAFQRIYLTHMMRDWWSDAPAPVPQRLWTPPSYTPPEATPKPEAPPPEAMPKPEGRRRCKRGGKIESEFDRLFRLRAKRLRGKDARPQCAEEIVGQQEALDQVTALLSGEPTHMLFVGPPGVGKTSVARLAFRLAKEHSPDLFRGDAPFIEIDGANLIYDDRGFSVLTSHALEGFYGNVHDRQVEKGLTGLPEVVLGSCARAHLGILFVDEIGELDPRAMSALLKVLEDGRELVTAGTWDPGHPNAPEWMREFFERGIPADFVLIGATTRPMAALPPALVSRCEIITFKVLTTEDRVRIAQQTAARLGVTLSEEGALLLARSTSSGREAMRRLRVARVRARVRQSLVIEARDVPPSSSTAERVGFR